MRLAQRWPCSIDEDLGLAVVSVFLRPDGDGELAPLLRRVENWVAYRSLGAIRYWLDDRDYILEAGFAADAVHPSEVTPGAARGAKSGCGRSDSIGGDVEVALESINVPSYVIDRTGIIRWLNKAARRLVGDVRGRQFTSVVAA